MSNYLFTLINHSKDGARSLEDPIAIIGHQLRALGHCAEHHPDKTDKFLVAEAGYNVIVEGFTDTVIDIMRQVREQGGRWLILATEEPTDRGFNHGQSPEMIMRQKQFPKAAQYADGILHLVPGERVNKWYSQFAPSAFADLGYAPTLVRPSDGVEPIYDFGFFGSLTRRRAKILKRLAKYIGSEKAVRVECTFAEGTKRDQLMRQSRVIVQIKKDERMELVSSSRLNTALCVGRPVIAEPHELSAPWDQVVKFSKTLDGFYADCLMARSAWRGVHAAQMEKFKVRMSPEICVGRALREIGVGGERVAA
jgi:hypothetical protein